MQHNPEIEHLIEQAIVLARGMKHKFVLTEHLLLAMIQHHAFRKCLDRFGVEVDQMEQEVIAYLHNLQSITSEEDDVQPRKTQSIERMFNRANVQVMFTGRRSMTTLDLYLSMMTETNSHAHYFLLKYGVKKQEFAEHWNQTYRQTDVNMSDKQAAEILDEYCINLTQRAREDQLEPLIGRARELEEMIAVLARRFKANVLMVEIGRAHV